MMGGVYFVTDADAPHPVLAQALAAARAGVRLIQLRDKTGSDDDMVALAQEILRAITPLGAKLIINDRVDVALRSGAQGLHIGQGDGDPRLIRQRIGPDMILGLSIDAPDQVALVPPGVVDYLGVGPVRATASKADHATPIGFDGLAQAVAAADVPCFAIGGVGLGDAAALRAAGAAGLAVVSAISRADDMQAAAADLIREWSVT